MVSGNSFENANSITETSRSLVSDSTDFSEEQINHIAQCGLAILPAEVSSSPNRLVLSAELSRVFFFAANDSTERRNDSLTDNFPLIFPRSNLFLLSMVAPQLGDIATKRVAKLIKNQTMYDFTQGVCKKTPHLALHSVSGNFSQKALVLVVTVDENA